MWILILSLVSFACAGVDRFEIKNLIQSTYTHDNTFCMLNGTRVEFELRGLNKFTDPKDKLHGEHLFYRNKNLLIPLPINKDRMHSYRFFAARDGNCSKSHAFKMDSATSAILLLKENHPYQGKLVIQLYDHLNHLPKEALETEYLTDEVVANEDGFAFRVVPERHEIDMGQIRIDDVLYTYQDRDFHPWMKYTLKGFETLGPMTFERFEGKKHFQSEADFFENTGWNATTKQFSNIYVYIAVNHALKKECLFVSPSKITVTGSEAWRCQ